MIKRALLITLLTISTAQAESLRKVELIRVIDGDTVEVTYTTSIRLNDVDCYENKHNARSKWQASEYDQTEEVIAKGNEKNLYLQVKGLDRYRRILGKLYIGKDRQVDINEYMLNKGECLPYKPRRGRPKKGAR